MFKIVGDGITYTPVAVDFNTLTFHTEYEAIQILEKNILNGRFTKVNNRWLLDGDESKWFAIEGSREWSINSFNPCKQESGQTGEKVYDFFYNAHQKITNTLKGKIACYCCREVNYRVLKYGLLSLFLPFIPYLPFVGFFMIVLALGLRNIV